MIRRKQKRRGKAERERQITRNNIPNKRDKGGGKGRDGKGEKRGKGGDWVEGGKGGKR